MKQTELKIKLGGLPFPFVVFGYTLILMCLAISIDRWYIMIALIAAGIFIITAKDYMLFDFNKKTLYKYSLLLFMKTGKYIDLSKVQYISMVRVNVSQKMWVASISRTALDTMISTNFILPNNKRMQLYRMNYKESIKFNTIIANGLDLKILDISTGEKQWIEPNIQKHPTTI